MTGFLGGLITETGMSSLDGCGLKSSKLFVELMLLGALGERLFWSLPILSLMIKIDFKYTWDICQVVEVLRASFIMLNLSLVESSRNSIMEILSKTDMLTDLILLQKLT
jgi:hypothetical protein